MSDSLEYLPSNTEVLLLSLDDSAVQDALWMREQVYRAAAHSNSEELDLTLLPEHLHLHILFPLKPKVMPGKKNDELAQSPHVRVLCWVMTRPENLQKKLQHIRATWAKHCKQVLYMSSQSSDFPTVGLNVSEGRSQLYWKTIRAFQYLHAHHLQHADWFLKADDDTFVVVENLRYLLSHHDTEEPVYFGHKFPAFRMSGLHERRSRIRSEPRGSQEICARFQHRTLQAFQLRGGHGLGKVHGDHGSESRGFKRSKQTRNI